MPPPTAPLIHLPRRDLLRAGLFTAAAGALSFPRPTLGVGLNQTRTPKARNVIFMVADGMSIGTLTLAEIWNRVNRQAHTNWVSLFNKPGVRRALATTFSADAYVTDSAAAGSAWGCGRRINNGAFNVAPDGTQFLPILPHARQFGKATGVVTTTTVTHATPASFIVNDVMSRDSMASIAQQLLDRGIDVMLGGGAKYFPQATLDKYPDLAIARDSAQLRDSAEKGKRLLGVFDQNHVSMVLDRPSTCPSLTEMSRIAISRLARNSDGFVLQIEGGRVDHAAHTNDAASLIREQLDFDDAIAEVLKFTTDRDDTLVILTTDHGTANPGLTIYGPRGEEALKRIAAVKHSWEWIQSQLVDRNALKPAEDRLTSLVQEATLVSLDPTQKSMLQALLQDRRVLPFGAANNFGPVLAAVLADTLGVGFASPNHTSDLVEVTAFGPGSQRLNPYIENIDLHQLMVESLGLDQGKLLPGMDQKLLGKTSPYEH